MSQYKRVLVLAPHTDDGELGCGGSISRFVEEGADVFYAAFSTCKRSLPEGLAENTLEKEAKAATKMLGIKSANLAIYDYDVRYFPTNRQPILEDLVKLSKDIKPDLVFVPAATDIHQDHQVIFQEGLRAFKATTMFGYELPWNNFSFTASCFVKLKEQHVQKKIIALKEYKSQSHRKYMKDSFIRGLAQTRGIQTGVDWAEAFELIRLIV